MKNLMRYFRKRRAIRKTKNELMKLTDRELMDLGLNRYNIRRGIF